MNYIKRYWKFPIISFFLLILCLSAIGIVRSYYDFHIAVILSLFVYFSYTYFSLRKIDFSQEKNIRVLLILSPFVILTIMAFFIPILDMMPVLVFFPSIGILIGYIFVNVNKSIKPVVFIIPILLSIWVFTSFAKIWQDFMIYRTFSSGQILKDAPKFTFYKNGESMNNDDFKGKTSIFYIWNTSCPYTPRYIPSLITKQENFSSNPHIKFYAVQIPLEGDTTGSDLAYLSKHAANIESLVGPNIKEMAKIFGQAPIPLTIILNPEGKLVFWGNIDNVDETIEKYNSN